MARSNVTAVNPELLRQAAEDFPAQIALDYLQVPKLDARIPRLAVEVTRGQTNNYDPARAVEQYLGSHYGYTLKLSEKPPADPLAAFLFLRKQGHCEYFGSSMAIILRTLRIPARVVNGARSCQCNALTSGYISRCG